MDEGVEKNPNRINAQRRSQMNRARRAFIFNAILGISCLSGSVLAFHFMHAGWLRELVFFLCAITTIHAFLEMFGAWATYRHAESKIVPGNRENSN